MRCVGCLSLCLPFPVHPGFLIPPSQPFVKCQHFVNKSLPALGGTCSPRRVGLHTLGSSTKEDPVWDRGPSTSSRPTSFKFGMFDILHKIGMLSYSIVFTFILFLMRVLCNCHLHGLSLACLIHVAYRLLRCLPFVSSVPLRSNQEFAKYAVAAAKSVWTRSNTWQGRSVTLS